MSVRRERGWLFWLSLLVALLLALVPLPEALQALKPYWPALILLFWILEAPETATLGIAFLFGIVADLLFGSLLGEQAVRLVVLAFIAQRFRSRIRFFPLWQQALAVLVLLLNDHIVLMAIRAFAGEGWPPAGFWLAPLVGMLMWPWVFLAMDAMVQWRRARR